MLTNMKHETLLSHRKRIPAVDGPADCFLTYFSLTSTTRSVDKKKGKQYNTTTGGTRTILRFDRLPHTFLWRKKISPEPHPCYVSLLSSLLRCALGSTSNPQNHKHSAIPSPSPHPGLHTQIPSCPVTVAPRPHTTPKSPSLPSRIYPPLSHP
jgi:hypothetical protein